MRIIIAGAGAVGFHLAELLSKENQDTVLIDMDEEVLSHANDHLDVMTIRGDAASISILEEADVASASIFLAVTTSEKTNMLLTILAKQMGAKKTIARITSPEYLKPKEKERFMHLGIDEMISPTQIAAEEILRLLERASFTDLFEFEGGKFSIVGISLDTNCPLNNKRIAQVEAEVENFSFRGIALLRNGDTIIPSADTLLLKGDHLYLATQNKYLDQVRRFVGKTLQPINNIMIIGGTNLALTTAKLLEDKHNITVVMEDKRTAKHFVEEIDRGMVIKAAPGNIDALKEEGLGSMDAFIALTPDSEINILTSLTAEHLGVYKTIALVDNVNYTHISQNIGIDTIINKKLIAANSIFRFVRKGKVEAVASLHGVDAEIIEFIIHKKNRLLKHQLKDLHFPKHSIIAGVIRGEDSFIPDGEFTFHIDDKVIILVLADAINQVEEIFK